ncbi:solute carrier family 35 member F6-like [Ruditapes philippinarum]|uniref:solute carrier family 35 member F6-like n=1 Tax=Ruditapes philippinarum TaxID=129788 RepID=UPI00295ACE2D|nr:solute carrier family 35 member F6-like [Ruditapes philippinarum]
MGQFTTKQILLMVCMLISGGVCTLCRKAQFDCMAKGYNGKVHRFNHPWFQTWMLFTAQCFCLFGVPILRRRQAQQYKRKIVQTECNGVLLTIQEEPPTPARLCQWIIIIPTCSSLVACSLIGIGLLYVDASIMLMLKGSVIISTGLFSHVFLNRKLKLANWIGIAVVIVGLVLAGCSSVFKSQGHKSNGGNATTGVILIICAQIIAGGQFTLEEALLKSRSIHTLHFVGLKGIYGFVLMTFVILPALYFIPGDNINGSFENSIDALYQISNSPQLLSFCVLYIIGVAVYNCCAKAVFRSLSAVHSTLIDACRTIMVWAVGMTIYYGFDQNFGEPFDKSYGILQVDGFLFLVIGTSIYKNILEIRNFVPCWSFSRENNLHINKSHNGCVEQSVDSDNNSHDEKSPLLTVNKA